MLDLTYLRLGEPQPSPQGFLIERLSEQRQVARMIAVSGKDSAHVPALECRPELIRLKELAIMSGGRVSQLVMLLAVALAAQPGIVVSGERDTTGLAPASHFRAGTSSHAGRSPLP
ncbi:MAG: hypothetical protein ACRDRH_03580 [Pseudonocardia sp.]